MSAQIKEMFNEDPLIVSAVPSTMIELIWERVEPLIRSVEALAPEDIDTVVVKENLLLGEYLLVAISRKSEIIAINVMTVRILDAGTRVLYIPITAGAEMELWLDQFFVVAKAIAKDYNCTEMRGLAIRKGWIKKLEPYGWEEMFTTIRCKLGEK